MTDAALDADRKARTVGTAAVHGGGNGSDDRTQTRDPARSGIILAWSAAAVPLAWGVYSTLTKAIVLLR